MKTKKILASILAVASALTLTACNQSENTPADTTAPANTGNAANTDNGPATEGGSAAATAQQPADDVTIPEGLTLSVITNRTDRVDDGYFKDMVKPFEEKYKCTVEFEGIKKYNSDMATRMTTDQYGDVSCIPSKLALSDLSNYYIPLGSEAELSETYNWVNQKSYQGVCYGLPIKGDISSGIVYNKKVWADAGITKLPTSPEEFIEDLKKIKESNPDVIPYYTNFKDIFASKEWEHLPLAVSGDPDYKNKALIEKQDILVEGTPYYKIYSLMYDIMSDPTLIEADPVTSDWERAKIEIGEGKIGAMTLGGWAFGQIRDLAANKDDIGYMPPPFNIDGKQYAETSADTAFAINKHIDQDHQNLSWKFIQWFLSAESPFAKDENGISTIKEGGVFPEGIDDFDGVELFTATPAPEAIADVWDAINKESGVMFDEEAADRFVLKIEEAAILGEGKEVMDEILAENNEKWNKTRDANEALNAYIATLS